MHQQVPLNDEAVAERLLGLLDYVDALIKLDERVPSQTIDPDHGDLFFPKPFNDDQVQIIRRLEKSEGLVVQGPPGTGKTHSIANIISHMLATGKRVLVVSHGETALKVLRDHLPDGVRDLAISVTASEREGIKQVEKAVQLMLEIVNSVDANLAKQVASIRDLSAGIWRIVMTPCRVGSCQHGESQNNCRRN